MVLILGIALYSTKIIALPKGMASNLPAHTGAPFGTYNPHITIALSRRGSFAALVQPMRIAERRGESAAFQMNHAQPAVGGADVFIVRADGSRIILGPAPPQNTLQKVSPDNPRGQFVSIALADDGTPLATIGFPSGAIGVAANPIEDVYVWSNDRWNPAVFDRMRIDAPSVTIAAAETPYHFVCNGNYSGVAPILDEAETNAHYEEYSALLVDRGKGISLGYGSTTGMRGSFVVGYFAHVQGQGNPDAPPYPSYALEWVGGRRMTLGRGIAYGVNASGDAVGDDEPTLSQPGVPILWHQGRAFRLSDKLGSAYAISDKGTIVGQVEGRAFLINGFQSVHHVVWLDALVRAPGWHITAAYAIAASGRILAVGHHSNGPERILFLDPFERTRKSLKRPRS